MRVMMSDVEMPSVRWVGANIPVEGIKKVSVHQIQMFGITHCPSVRRETERDYFSREL